MNNLTDIQTIMLLDMVTTIFNKVREKEKEKRCKRRKCIIYSTK
jgi:hypothetical protein